MAKDNACLQPPVLSFANKRVLITGAAGFLGKALCQKMVGLGASVVALDLCAPPDELSETGVEWHQTDCSDADFFARVIPDTDVVFSLAGRCGHWDSMLDPMGDIKANTLTALGVLEACRLHAPSAHVLYAGTRQVYGKPNALPVREDHPLAPLDMNGIHKMAAELQHLLYFTHHGIKTTVLRLTNTYGPHMRLGLSGQSFVAAWLHRIVCGEDIILYGDGSQLRDLQYSEDAVNAFTCAASLPNISAGQIYNVGSGRAVSLLKIAELLLQTSGRRVQIRKEPFPPNLVKIEIGDYCADIQKIRTQLGWMPETSLEEGLMRTWKELQRNFESPSFTQSHAG
jgi:UDP-glucose 4-epimerase